MPPSPETYAESEYPTLAGWAPQRALLRDRWKLVLSTRPALFDLGTDPAEQHDLSAAQPSLVEGMTARVRALAARAAATPAAAATLAPDTADRLRSLGYVAPSRPAAAASETAIDPASAMADWTAFEGALAETAAGRTAQALPPLARLVQAHPASPLFASTYARALATAGRGRDALTRLRAAVAQWPGDASLYHDLAVVARQLGLDEEALRAERAARTVDARQPAAANGEGLLLAEAGRPDDAARAFAEAVRLDPTNAVYHANLGNAHRATGDLVGAEAAYRAALARTPGLPDAANGLGAVLVQQGRAAEAVPWLERAAQDPAFVEAHLNLGIALQESGDRARAAAQYRKVLATREAPPREREAARTLLARLERP